MIAFIVCVIFFRVAEGWVFFRTSCIGQLILGAPEKPPGIHIPNFDDTDDRRLLESLIKATTAAGLTIDQVNVGIVEVDALNAASLGNHTFLLFDGLGRLTPQQRDAVMAHEVAHDVLGHADQSKARHGTLSKTVGVLGALVNSNKEARDQVASWTGGLVFPAFEKEQEFAADTRGVEILRRMGYRRSAQQIMASALRALKDEYGDSGGGYFDSHPATSDRIKVIESSGK